MNRALSLALGLAALSAALAPAPAEARATLWVCDTGCDYDDLQDAVDGASSGDVLRLREQTYAGSVVVTKDLNIVGPRTPGAYATLDGSGESFALSIEGGASVHLLYLDITGVGGADGGLLYDADASVRTTDVLLRTIEDITVCASGCDYDALQTAIDAALPGDRLLLEAETYAGGFVVAKDLDLVGPSVGRATLDADGADVALELRSASVYLEALEITGVDGGTAALLVDSDAEAEVYQVEVSDNATTDGAALVYGALSGDLLTVSDNAGTQSASWDAGLYADGGGLRILGASASVSLVDAVFTNNNSAYGGAILNAGGALELTRATLLYNQGWSGGAVTNLSGVTRISQSSFLGNQAYFGGGLYQSQGEVVLTGNSFSGNQVTAYGAAWVQYSSAGTLSASGNSYTDNHSFYGGAYEVCYDLSAPSTTCQ